MYEAIIDDVTAVLNQDVPIDKTLLKIHLAGLDALKVKLLDAVCTARRILHTERDRLRMPKDKEYTDFDRITMLEASVADLQYDYDRLKGLYDLLEGRTNLGYRLL